MTDQEFYSFVSSNSAQQTLMNNGEFPKGWVSTYLDFTASALPRWQHEVDWPRLLFRSIHYASLHLPMKYVLWTSLNKRRNNDTERDIRSIQFESEMFVWSCVFDASKRSNLEIALRRGFNAQ